ncbi:hypothetical protein EV424DRAFT_1380063 [Suillus variegatus]|nr:hypothetical protein EV424DRAFT_1380063 [Suillus variegatus]
MNHEYHDRVLEYPGAHMSTREVSQHKTVATWAQCTPLVLVLRHFCYLTATIIIIQYSPILRDIFRGPPQKIPYHLAQKMRCLLLAVVVVLTASMFVNACEGEAEPCAVDTDCCNNNCADDGVSMNRSLCDQDSIT